MARVQEFYKGRRKRRNYLFIPFVVLLAVISLAMVTFYGLQKYAVITQDEVKIALPILAEEGAELDSMGQEVETFETVSVSINYLEPDYSHVKAVAGEDIPELRAIFVPYTDLNHDKLQEYAARLNRGNGLLFEMKPRSGELMFESKSAMAQGYMITPNQDAANAVKDFITQIRAAETRAENPAEKTWLAAQISCCLDELLPTRTSAFSIKTELGMNYRDEKGSWLDAYNTEVRSYIADLARELFAMGFDEVVLADVAHPTLTEAIPLMYTREISTQRSTQVAVCGFAIDVAEQLSDRESGILSIYCDTRPALVKPDLTTGQDARVFMKVYDRVYLRTDRSAYSYNVEDIRSNVELGNVYDRLMPVVENYIPAENTSWILVDVPEEDDD